MKSNFTADENGTFLVKNTEPGEWLISYLEYSDEPLGRITIPSKPFILDEKDKEKNVLFNIPETATLLRMNIVDKDNGEQLKGISFNCINRDRFIFSPCLQKVKGDNPSYPEFHIIQDEEGRILFGKLPPGKYRMFSDAHGYYPISSEEFEIFKKEPEENGNPESEIKQDDEIVDLRFELEKGGKVVFRLPDNYNTPTGEVACVSYHLSDPESGGQILENHWGPYWGTQVDFPSSGPKEAVIILHPGNYILHATLRERATGFNSTTYTSDLWAFTSEVTIEKEKDYIISIDIDTE